MVSLYNLKPEKVIRAFERAGWVNRGFKGSHVKLTKEGKTRYPGIFQYLGSNSTAYGIDYRVGGRKHREIIGSLLGEAQEKLAEKKKLAKKGTVLSASEKRKTGRGDRS